MSRDYKKHNGFPPVVHPYIYQYSGELISAYLNLDALTLCQFHLELDKLSKQKYKIHLWVELNKESNIALPAMCDRLADLLLDESKLIILTLAGKGINAARAERFVTIACQSKTQFVLSLFKSAVKREGVLRLAEIVASEGAGCPLKIVGLDGYSWYLKRKRARLASRVLPAIQRVGPDQKSIEGSVKARLSWLDQTKAVSTERKYGESHNYRI